MGGEVTTKKTSSRCYDIDRYEPACIHPPHLHASDVWFWILRGFGVVLISI
jgi:hypothetical protein